jgi:hypothetical protein
MTRHSAREKIKNVIILLLIVSAVLLGWVSRLFGNDPVKPDSIAELWKSISGVPAASPGTEEKLQAAAMPVTVAVTDGITDGISDGISDGIVGRYGIKYNLDDLNDLYNKTVTTFMQALGSAQTPQETTEKAWQSALKSLGVYYEYLTPVSLSILAGWYNADIEENWGAIAVRRLCVTFSDGKTHLYFQDAATGKFFASETAVLNNMAGLPGLFDRNSAVFAFEIREKSNREESMAPYTLLTPDVTEHPVLTAKNPLSDDKALADVLLSLGVNENATPNYPDESGTMYIASVFNLHLAADGTIVYYLTGNKGAPDARPMSESEAITVASRKVSETVGSYCGQNAAVYYDSDRALDEGGYQVYFRYVAEGGAIWLHPDGYAASVIVQNGIITEAVYHFRAYEALKYDALDNPAVMLPELLAEAAAPCDFMLGYDDNGGAALNPSWVRLPLQP